MMNLIQINPTSFGRISSFIILLFFSLSLNVLQGSSDPQATFWPTTGWQTSSLEEQGINSSYIDDLKDHINVRDLNIRSILIVRNGY